MSKVSLVFRDTYTLKEASHGNRSSLDNPGVSIRVLVCRGTFHAYS